ncbi:unnamed protein product [Ixodes persulcatus]
MQGAHLSPRSFHAMGVRQKDSPFDIVNEINLKIGVIFEPGMPEQTKSLQTCVLRHIFQRHKGGSSTRTRTTYSGYFPKFQTLSFSKLLLIIMFLLIVPKYLYFVMIPICLPALSVMPSGLGREVNEMKLH